MADSKKFFDALKSRISAQPDDQFDKSFWTAFENEFESKNQRPAPRRRFPFLSGPPLYWVGAPLCLILIAWLVVFQMNRRPGEVARVAPTENFELISQLDQYETLLENYEVFEQLAEKPLSREEMERIARDGAR